MKNSQWSKLKTCTMLLTTAVVMYSCSKESASDVKQSDFLPNPQIPQTGGSCVDDCIKLGATDFYPVSDMATGSSGPNTKSVSYTAYNTETDFVVEVTYAITAGKSKAEATITIDIDGDEMEHIGVSSGSMVSHTVPLAQGWAGCDDVVFSIVQEGLGAPISFNESYDLIPVCTEESLKIGDAYMGGIIAYILKLGDPGYVSGETHGIIAAPWNQSTDIQWAELPINDYIVTGATGTALGTGQANTTAIVDKQGPGSYAAQLCNDLDLNSYTDWYLPSKDELNKLYLNKEAIGGFGEYEWFWSSSEFDLDEAWSQGFEAGVQNDDVKGNYSHSVRAIRAF